MSKEFRSKIKQEILDCVDELHSSLYSVDINMYKLLEILVGYEDLETKCEIYENALKNIANEDFRGNRPEGSVKAFQALQRVKEMK